MSNRAIKTPFQPETDDTMMQIIGQRDERMALKFPIRLQLWFRPIKS